MIELRPHFPLAGLLRTACLPRSSFYYQQKALKTIDKHCDLKTKIREIYDRHRESPRFLRRLNTLRGLSHEQVEQVLTRGP